MYSCGGTPKNSTKETIEGYNKLIGQLKTKLDVRIFDLTIIEMSDEILIFFDSIRIHKANKELDKHFHSTFRLACLLLPTENQNFLLGSRFLIISTRYYSSNFTLVNLESLMPFAKC